MNEKYINKTFSPAFLSRISGVSPSVLSRYISTNNIRGILNSEQSHRKKYSINTVRKIMTDLFSYSYKPEKKIQVFYNFKGGTGKTTISYQVSTLLAILGFKTLVVDIDPQAHLSSSFGFDPDDNYLTMYDVIVNKIPAKEVVQNIFPNFDIIPSNLSLTKIEMELMHMANRERVLSKAIDPLKSKYDFVIFDTNPTISTLNRNALYVADKVNIVCETQPYSLKGLEMLIGEIDNFSETMDTNVDYSIIPNKYESKTATSQEALGALRVGYKDSVMPSIVRKCEDMNISAKKREPLLFFCKKNSYALEDIVDLTKEILEMSCTKNLNQSEIVSE